MNPLTLTESRNNQIIIEQYWWKIVYVCAKKEEENRKLRNEERRNFFYSIDRWSQSASISATFYIRWINNFYAKHAHDCFFCPDDKWRVRFFTLLPIFNNIMCTCMKFADTRERDFYLRGDFLCKTLIISLIFDIKPSWKFRLRPKFIFFSFSCQLRGIKEEFLFYDFFPLLLNVTQSSIIN